MFNEVYEEFGIIYVKKILKTTDEVWERKSRRNNMAVPAQTRGQLEDKWKADFGGLMSGFGREE
jgi:hypothetical protein